MEEEPHKKKQESVEVELKISTQKEGYIIREGECRVVWFWRLSHMKMSE